MSNYQLITDGFRTLRASLAPFIARELIKAHGNENWWKEGVWGRLYDYQRRNIPEEGSFDECVDSLDVANCLLLIDINWRNIFRNVLSQDSRALIYELKGARNRWAHFGGEQQTARDAWRTLDTMSRLCMEIDSESAAEIEELIGQIGHDELPSTPVADEPKSEPDKPMQEGAADTQVAKPTQSRNGAWRFKPKSRWSQAALLEAVERWCGENQRTLMEGFKDLPFLDAAEATLAMPLLGDNGSLAFRNAANNVIFQIADAKMMALTVPRADERQPIDNVTKPDLSPIETKANESNSPDVSAFSNSQGHNGLFEQFEHIPKKKVSWTRDDILEIACRWAEEHARLLPALVTEWRHDTLADMILSRFPEQSDPAVSFNDSLPETLFAPNARKLFIITHQ